MDDFTAHCQRRASQAMDHFLRNLSHVPPDKLHWSPAPTAKNALQIAAHAAAYSGAFAEVIATGRLPESLEEFLGPINARIQSVTTVQEAEEMLRQGISETVAALAAVEPERLDSMVAAPVIGSMPFRFFMTIPADHLIGHVYQIDYLQTCCGDMEIYF